MSQEPENKPENPLQTDRTSTEQIPAEDFAAPGASEAEQLGQLREANRQLTDQLLRKQADMENLRKRLAREKEDFLQFSNKQMMESLLPILDGFELALAAEGGSDGYRKGVELIYEQLQSTLRRMGLEPIEAKGKIFDPHLHEAIATVESSRYRDQEVVEEMQRGYLLKNRLLRPSRVRVAKRPALPTGETILNLDE